MLVDGRWLQLTDALELEVLERVNIQSAGMAILLTDTLTPRSDQDRDARTVLAALTIERLKPDVFCCAELPSREQLEEIARGIGWGFIIAGLVASLATIAALWWTPSPLGSESRSRKI